VRECHPPPLLRQKCMPLTNTDTPGHAKINVVRP
jgi:hypothetical protein